ncbi:hypothetical protein AB0M28_19505 [Streptomyces sp. NPDC051940]|uniref:hypothetical protein n=1 Tax=Streptomyces sp. NPDC051940 TaxID=3155675 RepID=UPI0034337B38
MGMTRRRLLVLPVCLAALGAAACGQDGEPRTETAFEDGGVAVRVTVEGDRVTAVLTPQRETFHLYSLSLPDEGVDGLGIPTRLSVSDGLTATGTAHAPDARERTLRPAGLGVELPVYEDGPVTVVLPVRRSGGAESARVHLSYGACSESLGCLPPVRDRVVGVRLP